MKQKQKEKIQIIEGFLAIMEKTHQMEIDNKNIPSVANQYKYKKEELFNNFVLSLIELMPLDNMSLFGDLKIYSLILNEQEKLSINQALSFDKYLENLFKNIEKHDDDINYISNLRNKLNSFIST